jgi:ABC-type multidrug transport system fused ATPase/permease subunit
MTGANGMRSEKRLDWKSLFNLVKGANVPKWMIVLGIGLSLLETVARLIVPWFTKNLVDQLSIAALNPSIIVLLGITFILQTAAGAFSYYFLAYMGESVVASIRRKLWNQVLHLQIPYFDQHESGETMSRITQDTNIVKNLITYGRADHPCHRPPTVHCGRCRPDCRNRKRRDNRNRNPPGTAFQPQFIQEACPAAAQGRPDVKVRLPAGLFYFSTIIFTKFV